MSKIKNNLPSLSREGARRAGGFKTFIILITLLFLFISPINAQSEIKKTDHLTSTISQKDFSTDEIPQIKINKTNPQNLITFISQIFGKKPADLKDTIKIVVTDPDNKIVDSSYVQITANSDNQIKIAIEPEKLIPGKYEIKITDSQTNETVIQDFTWGVLVINPDQSVYSIGNTAFLAMAVLDESGDMVCNADLALTVTSPDNSVSELSLSAGTITRNPECRTKNITLIPDFQAFLPLSQTGTYQLKLTAITKNGSYSITDSLLVESNPNFIIKRLAATRIYPPNNYPVSLEITSSQDFVGTIIEKVPLNFLISNTNAKITKDSSSQILSWETSLKAFQTISYSYSYLAPQISPALYFLGPISLTNSQNQIYTEARSWQIAADAIPGTLTVTSVGTTYWTIPANVFSITIEAWAGGGGGGSRTTNGLGGGGGGGAYSKKNAYSVTPGQTLPITVGEGGSAGNNGGNSYVVNTSTLLAIGGSGVPVNTSTGVAGGPAASGVGDTKYSGGNGGNGGNISGMDNGGGGGGGAGNANNGVGGTTPTGGNGGTTGGGDGGDGRNALGFEGPGNNGSSSGGGGGGAVRILGWLPPFTGGDGAPGKVVITYLINEAPTIPTLIFPADTAVGVSQTPTFRTVTTDPDGDYIQYELKICTDSGMSTSCQTFDQTSSNVGWSGQNVGTSAYSSGTTATYVLQAGNSLAVNTTYYWKTRAKDPAGSNSWSDTQTNPFSFNTNQAAAPESLFFRLKGIKLRGVKFK